MNVVKDRAKWETMRWILNCGLFVDRFVPIGLIERHDQFVTNKKAGFTRRVITQITQTCRLCRKTLYKNYTGCVTSSYFILIRLTKRPCQALNCISIGQYQFSTSSSLLLYRIKNWKL